MSVQEPKFKLPFLKRAQAAARILISSVQDNPNYFSPGQPMRPMGPEEQRGRAYDFPVAFNTQINSRSQESGPSFAELRALAEYHDITRLLIETRKDQLEALPWAVKPIVRADEKKSRDEVQDRAEKTEEFMQSPDGDTSFRLWQRMLVEDMLVIDAPALYVNREIPGNTRFQVMDGATIMRRIDVFGRTPRPPDPAYQQIIKGLPSWNYTSEELMYRPRNLRPGRAYGMSPVQQIIMTVNIALRKQTWQLEYFQSGNIPDALVSVPEDWTPDQIVTWQAAWDSLMEGNLSQRRKAKFVPGKMTVHETKQAQLKDDFDEWLTRVACFAFSISPLAFIKMSNRATAEVQKKAAEEEGLSPMMRHLKAIYDEIIQVYLGQTDLEFQWSDKEDMDPQTQAQIDDLRIRNGTRTINESRLDEGKEPVEGGDVPMIFTASGPIPVAQAAKGLSTSVDGQNMGMPGQDPNAPPGKQMPGRGPAGKPGGGANGKPPAGNAGGQGKPGKPQPKGGPTSKPANGRPAASGAAPKKARPFTKSTARPLYVCRKLINTAEVVEWFSEQGLEDMVLPEDMHVTIAHSEAPVDWDTIPPTAPDLSIGVGRRDVVELGNDGATVLRFESFALYHRWAQLRDLGASWDFPLYKPHITIAYNSNIDPEDLEPFPGVLEFGPEIIEPLDESDEIVKYNPDQPRAPAGSSDGGQWTSGGGMGGGPEVNLGPTLGESINDDIAWDAYANHGPVAGPLDPNALAHLEAILREEVASGHEFVSPSISSNLNLQQAQDALSGPRQALLQLASAEVDKTLGMNTIDRAVVGAWADGAENAMMTVVPNSEWDKMELSAAMKGSLANQKAVLIFQADKNGKDALVSFNAYGTLDDIHQSLLKAGLENHTLQPMPQGAKVFAVVSDEKAVDAAQKAAKPYDSHPIFTTGRAAFIGTSDWSAPDAEARDAAQKEYSRIIAGSRVPGAQAAWDGLHSNWSQAFHTIKKRLTKRLKPGQHYGTKINLDTPLARKTEQDFSSAISAVFKKVAKSTAAEVVAFLKSRGLAKADNTNDDITTILHLKDFRDLVRVLPDLYSAMGGEAAKAAIFSIGAQSPDALFDTTSDAVVDFADERAGELIGMKLVDGEWIDNPNPEWSITQTTRDSLRQLIAYDLDKGSSLDEISDDILDSVAFSEARADMIARTETMFAQNAGAQAGYSAAADSGLTVLKQWVVGAEACDDCLDLADQDPIPEDESWDGPDGPIDYPPLHPNCRCSTIPVVDEGDSSDTVDNTDNIEAVAKRLFGKTFNDDEPRDDAGRWTSGGSTTSEAAAGGIDAATHRLFQVKGTLRNDQMGAVTDYADVAYSDINRFLRGGLVESQQVASEKEIKSSIELIDSAMSQSVVKADMIVYRGGIGWETHGWASVKPGSTVTLPTYVSTTLDKKLVYKRFDARGSPFQTYYKILVPKGAHALAVNQIGGDHVSFPEEHEVILPHGQKYVVDRIDVKQHEVSLRMIP